MLIPVSTCCNKRIHMDVSIIKTKENEYFCKIGGGEGVESKSPSHLWHLYINIILAYWNLELCSSRGFTVHPQPISLPQQIIHIWRRWERGEQNFLCQEIKSSLGTPNLSTACPTFQIQFEFYLRLTAVSDFKDPTCSGSKNQRNNKLKWQRREWPGSPETF